MSTAVLAGVLCRPGPPERGWVAWEDGALVDVQDGAPPPGSEDVGDAVLAPAFLDLQLNGSEDVDLATADGAAWAALGSRLARHGVAAYLATFVSAPLDSYDAVLRHLTAARRELAPRSACPLGAHLEGPFLGAAPGAHPVELLRPADLVWLERLFDAHPGLVRMVTLAPEADPELRAGTWLAAHGVLVALGHSMAGADEARAAADAGARVVTHVFNGLGPLHHRAPGLAGVALDDDRLTPTLIGDFVHVDPTVARIVFAASRTVALVSDAVATPPDRRRDDAARLADGRLVGATALLDDAVANLVGAGVPIQRVVAAASTTPADLIGATDRGRLEPGRRADLVVLDPGTGRLRRVVLGGDDL
ncbi:MAG TPA: amidohydrolase family protein [Acidimicrobiia bacterium]|nr:amidohydrolase family protein [Acidimicrobiia bacterium]